MEPAVLEQLYEWNGLTTVRESGDVELSTNGCEDEVGEATIGCKRS